MPSQGNTPSVTGSVTGTRRDDKGLRSYILNSKCLRYFFKELPPLHLTV